MVLPRRSRHQTPLLVSSGRAGQASQGHRFESPTIRKAGSRRREQPMRSVRSPTRAPNCPRRRVAEQGVSTGPADTAAAANDSGIENAQPASARDAGSHRPSSLRVGRKAGLSLTSADPAHRRHQRPRKRNQRWPPPPPPPRCDHAAADLLANQASSDPDAADRHRRRAVACRPDGKRHFPARPHRANGAPAPTSRPGRLTDRTL